MIYGNKFLLESNNNDISFYDKIDNKSNNYCNKICDSLSKEERKEFGLNNEDEKFMDKENFARVKNKLMKRIVVLFNKDAGAFIEVYKENRKGINYGEICIATHSKHRNKGYASMLMEKVIEWYRTNNIDIDSLTYPVDGKNTSSINLAKKFGFKKMSKKNFPFDLDYYDEYPVYQYKK